MKCCVSLYVRYIHLSIHPPTIRTTLHPLVYLPSGHLCTLWSIYSPTIKTSLHPLVHPPTIRTSLHPLVHLSINHQDISEPWSTHLPTIRTSLLWYIYPLTHQTSVHLSNYYSMYLPIHTCIHPSFHSHTIKCLLKTCLVKIVV